jgi:hypothetical protein
MVASQGETNRRASQQRTLPLLATVPQDVVADLDGLFEYTLARHLDGLAALIESDHTS